jgi:hypothetical protein
MVLANRLRDLAVFARGLPAINPTVGANVLAFIARPARRVLNRFALIQSLGQARGWSRFGRGRRMRLKDADPRRPDIGTFRRIAEEQLLSLTYALGQIRTSVSDLRSPLVLPFPANCGLRQIATRHIKSPFDGLTTHEARTAVG